jgi:hypothetical protein
VLFNAKSKDELFEILEEIKIWRNI